MSNDYKNAYQESIKTVQDTLRTMDQFARSNMYDVQMAIQQMVNIKIDVPTEPKPLDVPKYETPSPDNKSQPAQPTPGPLYQANLPTPPDLNRMIPKPLELKLPDLPKLPDLSKVDKATLNAPKEVEEREDPFIGQQIVWSEAQNSAHQISMGDGFVLTTPEQPDLQPLPKDFDLDIPDITIPDVPDFLRVKDQSKDAIEPFKALSDQLAMDVGTKADQVQADGDQVVTTIEGLHKAFDEGVAKDIKGYLTCAKDCLARFFEKGIAGLSGSAIHEARYQQSVDHELAQGRRAREEAVEEWASRGYTLPQGALARALEQVRQQEMLRVSDLNRTAYVESMQREMDFFYKCLDASQQVFELEQRMYEHTCKQVMDVFALRIDALQKLLEVKRSMIQMAIEVLREQSEIEKMVLERFRTEYEAFKVRLEAALLPYRSAELKAAHAKNMIEVNNMLVGLYGEQLKEARMGLDAYEQGKRMQIAQTERMTAHYALLQKDVENAKFLFEGEKMKLEKMELDTKAIGFESEANEMQARMFASNIQGLSAQADLKGREYQANMEVVKALLSQYLADVDVEKAKMQASLSETQYTLQAYQANVDAWKAKVMADTAVQENKVKYADMVTRTNIAYAEMQKSAYASKTQVAIEKAKIALEGSRAVGQLSAQLAAGAMSAMHVSASISGSGSANSSSSISNSESKNYNYNL